MIWATVAAELARYGLGRVAHQLEKNPAGRVALDVARSLNVDPTPQAIADKIASDPEALERLRTYEFALMEMDEASRENARANNGNSYMPAIIAGLMILMVAGFVWALFTQEPPESNRDMINLALGTILGWAGASIAYHVGSSRGSTTKENTLTNIVKR